MKSSMNLMNRVVLVAAGAIALWSGSAAVAQAQSPLQARIPFSFIAGGSTLPAGSYYITREMAQTNAGVIRLWNAKERHATIVLGTPVDTYRGGAALMTFECGGDACSLREIRTPNGAVSYPHHQRKSAETKLVFVSLEKSGV